MLQNHWFLVELHSFLSQRKIRWPFDTDNKRLRSRLNTTQAGMDLLRRIMPPLAQPLIDYFNLAFQSVSGVVTTGNGTRRQTYPPSVRNVHDITVNNADRTNNFTEAWNRSFQTLLSENHLSVGTCIELLQEADAAQAASILLKHANGIIERWEDDADGSRCKIMHRRLHGLCME